MKDINRHAKDYHLFSKIIIILLQNRYDIKSMLFPLKSTHIHTQTLISFGKLYDTQTI